ncbi:hypothetical protein TWF696_007117 [Orbilia brochopaga]|uniref:Uncharacterized protein n=1 Tax=Orbilia brochopaga TaxID=3140254 RepID=A0AAV9UR02_9PEZI
MAAPIAAVLFDIGGVVVRSPLLAIEAYETAHDLPSGYINWNIYHGGQNSAWKQLERNEIPMDDGFFHGFHADLNNPDMWVRFLKEKGLALSPAPLIDAKWLFWEMMRVSREIDPYMLNAIQKLRETRKYRLGEALLQCKPQKASIARAGHFAYHRIAHRMPPSVGRSEHSRRLDKQLRLPGRPSLSG